MLDLYANTHMPAQPGRPRRQDYEYRRGGTRNIFLTCEPLAGWRHIITRARILLRTEEGWSANQVVAALDTSQRTVFRTKRRFTTQDARHKLQRYPCHSNRLDGVLHDHPQANRYRKLDDKGEAYLIALACSDAPEGHDHWTLRLLADQAVELGLVESLSHETVRLRLKKTSSSRGGSNSGASPR